MYLIANKTQNIIVFRNSTVYGLLLGQCRDSDYSLLLGQCRDIDYYWDSVEMSYSISQPVKFFGHCIPDRGILLQSKNF